MATPGSSFTPTPLDHEDNLEKTPLLKKELVTVFRRPEVSSRGRGIQMVSDQWLTCHELALAFSGRKCVRTAPAGGFYVVTPNSI
ncbi:hypothetical protein TNCV_4550171 [Trichonephila clavipes]|nr:hypothetical protein TNCV_4550171 [Trichonephila clavipes]